MSLFNIQLSLLWLYLTAGIFVYGVLVVFLPSLVPNTLASIYKYGKSSEKCQKSFLVDLVSIPKRWFLHFYIMACIFHLYLLYSVFTVYFLNKPCPALLSELVNIFGPRLQRVSVLPESVVVAVVLMVLQVFRRLYECLYISVFSNARMSLLHYCFGLYFYPAVGMSLILEAPGFNPSNIPIVHDGLHFLKANLIAGAILFVVGWLIEFNSHCILANLRKNKKGVVCNQKYSIPKGGLFNLVSCPNYLGEVTMYLAVAVVFWGHNWTWWAVVLNVLVNQTIAALMSHQWYKGNFKDYPPQRKALIPFLL